MSDAETTETKLGEYLHAARKLQGKTLRSIAGTALGSGYLSQIETGTIKDLTVSKLIKVAIAYDVPVASILADVYDVPTETPSIDITALQLGKTILGLPEPERELMIGWVHHRAANTHNGPA